VDNKKYDYSAYEHVRRLCVWMSRPEISSKLSAVCSNIIFPINRIIHKDFWRDVTIMDEYPKREIKNLPIDRKDGQKEKKLILNLKISKDGILFQNECSFNLKPRRKSKETIIEVEKCGVVVGYLYRYYDDKGYITHEEFKENFNVEVIWE